MKYALICSDRISPDQIEAVKSNKLVFVAT